MAGRQEELFFLPEIFDYEPRVIQITDNDIAKVLEEDNFCYMQKKLVMKEASH